MTDCVVRIENLLRHTRHLISNCFRQALVAWMALGCLLAYAGNLPPIVIGQSLNLGPSNYQIAKRWVAGATIYINAINSAGGINGRQIQLVTLDNDGNLKQHTQNIQTLISEHKAIAIINCAGDKECVASAKLANQTGVPLIGTIAGSRQLDSFRESRQVFSIRQSYDKEAATIAMQLSSMGVSKVAVLSDSKDSEKSESLASNLPKARITWEVFHIQPSNSATQESVGQKLADGSYQAVIFDLEPSTIDALYARNFFNRKTWPATNFSFANDGLVSLSNAFKQRVLGFTMVVPNPEAHSLSLVTEFQRNAERYSEPNAINFEGMESYINARICVEAIRRAGSKPSTESVTAAMRKMQSYDLGGYSVNFTNPTKPASTWLEIGLKTSNGLFIK